MKKQTKIILILILLCAFYIRFEAISVPRDFWHDEAFQYLYSEKPVSFILDSNDVHPPLFNLFTKSLFIFGSPSIFNLRFLMIAISILFLLYFFFTIREIFNENVAILSTALISFSFTYIYYAIEFRNYTFVLLFTILQIREFNRILNDNKAPYLYILFSLIMIYSHYLSGLIIFTQIFYLMLLRNKISIRWVKDNFVMAYYMIALFSIPLLIYLVKTLPKIQSFWFKDIDIISLISTFAYILVPPSDYIYGFATFYLVIIGVMIYYRAEIDLRVLQFSLYLILPVILMWSVSQAIPFYHHRYFLFGGIAFFVLLGWSADILKKKLGKDIDLFVVACWMVFFLIGITAFYSSFDTELLDSATFLYNHTNNGKDDFILIHESSFSQTPFKIYFADKRNYLMNNLTTEQLFSAGGSVIEDWERIDNLSYFEGQNITLYAVSDNIIGNKIIYEEGGIYVTEINSKN